MSHFTSMIEVAKAVFKSDSGDTKKQYTEDLSQLSSDEFISKLNGMARKK